MDELQKNEFQDVAGIIKDAIVRSRYQAAKLVNKELLVLISFRKPCLKICIKSLIFKLLTWFLRGFLSEISISLYYAVGRYVSVNSRGSWGQGAIKRLSESLQSELPGLRGFSESAIKRMRRFYEEWQPVLSNRPTLMGDSSQPGEHVRQTDKNPSIGILLCKEANRSVVEFAVRDYTKPMGVATYRTKNEMPPEYQNALPDLDEMKRLLDAAEDTEGMSE